jgi:small acid-soluble spore protein H (minor)
MEEWCGMDANAVKKILSSPKEIEVLYNGVSVWIEDLNEDEKTAIVHMRRSLEEPTQVNISELELH